MAKITGKLLERKYQQQLDPKIFLPDSRRNPINNLISEFFKVGQVFLPHPVKLQYYSFVIGVTMIYLHEKETSFLFESSISRPSFVCFTEKIAQNLFQYWSVIVSL